MTSELKPCPFCGGEAEAHETTDGWIVSCSSDQNVLDGFTHMVHAYGGTEAEAIDAWNTRAERTCTNVGYYIDSTRFKCSECGYNGWTKYANDGRDRVPQYCPNCGAKVVDE